MLLPRKITFTKYLLKLIVSMFVYSFRSNINFSVYFKDIFSVVRTFLPVSKRFCRLFLPLQLRNTLKLKIVLNMLFSTTNGTTAETLRYYQPPKMA